jgi:hypothetical protein
MDLLATLLLGHLIADFPLQANWVYRLKNRHWAGVLLHAAIHCLVTGVLIKDSLTYWPMLVVLGSTHFATDWLKLRIRFKFQSVGFVLDQIAHVLVLLLLVAWAPGMTGTLTPALLYPVVGYALVPAVLMFSSVLAADLGCIASDPSGRLENKVSELVLLSHMAGFPLVAGTVFVRIGGLYIF